MEDIDKTLTPDEKEKIVEKYNKLLDVNSTISERETESELRKLITEYGVPDQPIDLRGRIWIYFMHIDKIDADYYKALIEKGPSELSKKIKKDIHRTFAQSLFFTEKVSEEQLVRVLNAIAHDCGKYVQGMNVLCAPLLCCMSEVETFFVFRRLVTKVYPTYVLKKLDGVYAGIVVMDILLKIIDPELWEHFNKFTSLTNPVIWQFGYTMTFGANQPPLTEVMKLWDFLFAFGFSLNLLLLICRLLTIKNTLMNHPKPYELLRESLPINANDAIKLAIKLAPTIPQDIRKLMVLHMSDTEVCEELCAGFHYNSK